jgi:hypothetical protein
LTEKCTAYIGAASYPGSSNIVSVKIKGDGLDFKSLGKDKGRPKGSKCLIPKQLSYLRK